MSTTDALESAMRGKARALLRVMTDCGARRRRSFWWSLTRLKLNMQIQNFIDFWFKSFHRVPGEYALNAE